MTLAEEEGAWPVWNRNGGYWDNGYESLRLGLLKTLYDLPTSSSALPQSWLPTPVCKLGVRFGEVSQVVLMGLRILRKYLVDKANTWGRAPPYQRGIINRAVKRRIYQEMYGSCLSSIGVLESWIGEIEWWSSKVLSECAHDDNIVKNNNSPVANVTNSAVPVSDDILQVSGGFKEGEAQKPEDELQKNNVSGGENDTNINSIRLRDFYNYRYIGASSLKSVIEMKSLNADSNLISNLTSGIRLERFSKYADSFVKI